MAYVDFFSCQAVALRTFLDQKEETYKTNDKKARIITQRKKHIIIKLKKRK